MNAIVAVDRNWAIGRDNGLLFSLPGDMKRFRTLTAGGTLIMGRKTLDSFPGGRPLPKRRNIVITRDPAFPPNSGRLPPCQHLPLFGGKAERLILHARSPAPVPVLSGPDTTGHCPAVPRCPAASKAPPAPAPDPPA